MKEVLQIISLKKGFSLLVFIFCNLLHHDAEAGSKTNMELGIQLWTFHKFSFVESVEKAQTLGVKNLEIYFGQKLGEGFEGNMDFNMDVTTRLKIQELLNSKGMKIFACGVVRCKNETEWISLFEFANAMKIKIITAEPDVAFLDLAEKLADQYNIDVAIHNHPRPSVYWNPDTIMSALENRSRRMGVCADVGHWKRMGVEPVDALQLVSTRLKCLHLKDIENAEEKAKDVIWGKGVCRIDEIISQLLRKDFNGLLSIEYENNWENSVPDIKKCIEYFRKHIVKTHAK